jgi:hypothetical protein
MLYEAEAFEPLTDEPWDEARVRDRIREIVADADATFAGDELWPAEEWDSWSAATPMKNLYVGAAGVVWGLDALARRGHAESTLDLPAAAQRTLERWRAEPDFATPLELPTHPEAAFLTGESGILAVACRVGADASLADELVARVRENVDSGANELMWGSPGTMHAARALLDWTGDRRFADAWTESADELLRRRDADGLWTQRLYGQEYRSLGAPHGLVGTVEALLGGGDLLERETRDVLTKETADVVARTAVVEGGLANWALADGRELTGSDGEVRLQWCGGAPGIVISTAAYVDEELLLAGGELIWRAGPHGLEKGASICHGTAGNGYAFLKLFERTGDERWLERARRFAVHALGQVERLRERRGRGRYSLWTGDVGTALYAADCLAAEARYPVVDGL